jgi:hypothetical protein
LQRAEWEAAHHREALVHTIDSLGHRMTPAIMKRDFVALVRRKTNAVVANARRKPIHVAVFLGAVTATGFALARLRQPARTPLSHDPYQVL